MTRSILDELLSLDEVIAEHNEDPVFRAEWERTAPARALAIELVKYRTRHGLSQSALARRLGMSQPAVARMELGEHLPTLTTLARVARALDVEIAVDVLPPGRESVLLRDDAVGDDPDGITIAEGALLIRVR
jgi:transcriptional regulator with XRE-family HTH domain